MILPSVPVTLRTLGRYLHTDYPSVQGHTLVGHALVSGARILVGWAALLHLHPLIFGVSPIPR